jgi:hypothetical protein
MNPGITPSGLFWTTVIPAGSVSVNPGKGRASLQVRNIVVTDYGDYGNALFGGGPPPVPATVSFEVQWSGVAERVNVVNPTDGFAGEFVRNSAQMAWSATVGDYSFVSAPASTSSSIFAEVGHERNGVFFAR